MHGFRDMLKALPYGGRERSRSRSRSRNSQDLEGEEKKPVHGATTDNRKKWNLAPEKKDTVITIRDDTESNSVGQFRIECNAIGFSESIVISDRPTEEVMEQLRWFIEDFAAREPLKREEARAAHMALKQATGSLFKQMNLDGILTRLTSNLQQMTSPTVFIDVEGNFQTSDGIFCIPWELIEHPSLWPKDTSYTEECVEKYKLELVVRRKPTTSKVARSFAYDHHNSPSGGHTFEVSFSIGSVRESYPTYNILVIAARDIETQDSDAESQAQATRPLYAALSGLPESCHYNVRTCRPGSFEAAMALFEQTRPGYWHMVHLDLLMLGEKLGFAGGYREALSWLDASYVAERLRHHQVGSVFLTCHEAAPTGPKPPQPLASYFFNAGIPVVISAPYNLPKMFLMLMFSGYYQSLLALHQRGPSYAAHQARKCCQTQKIPRLGRYHIPVSNTAEGLALIVYESTQHDVLDVKQFNYARTDKSPKIFSTAYQDVWLFGRDLDIMKVEHQLLKSPTSNIMWITGQKGVGRTWLFAYLTWWWEYSRFNNTSTRIDLAACQDDFTGLMIQFFELSGSIGLIKKVSEKEINEIKSKGEIKKTKQYKDLVKALKEHRCYLVFDNVDRWRPLSSEKTPDNETLWAVNKKLFLNLIEELRGGASFVLLGCAYNDQSIAKATAARPFVLKRCSNEDIAQAYGIEEWDAIVPSSSDYLVERTFAHDEDMKSYCDYYDAVLQTTQGLWNSKSQFIYTIPFNLAQRSRDIALLLYTGSAGCTGPYAMDTSPAAMLVEQVYDLLVRDRADLVDKSPSVNPNIPRLLYSLCMFYGRVPKDIDTYLVLLSYMGLFTEDWTLPGPRYDHDKGEYLRLEHDMFEDSYDALETSKLLTEYHAMVDTLIEYDWMSPDPQRPEEYFTINPTLTYALRKIVFATDGPLTTPLLPQAISLAAQEYHILRFRKTSYSEHYSATSRIIMEKQTVFSIIMTAAGTRANDARQMDLIAKSPILLLTMDRFKEHVTDADRRILLYTFELFMITFAGLVESKVSASETTGAPASAEAYHLDPYWEDTFYNFWLQNWVAAQQISIYHNAVSGLSSSFNSAVLHMRLLKRWGQRYDESRKEVSNIPAFEASLASAEEVREELVSRGLIMENEGDGDQGEAPPAYEAGQVVGSA